jgi:hypothetical protein
MTARGHGLPAERTTLAWKLIPAGLAAVVALGTYLLASQRNQPWGSVHSRHVSLPVDRCTSSVSVYCWSSS